MPKVTCFQGQRLLIGQEIALTVNAIYKKKDGQRFVILDIDAPSYMQVFQERLVLVTDKPILPTELNAARASTSESDTSKDFLNTEVYHV